MSPRILRNSLVAILFFAPFLSPGPADAAPKSPSAHAIRVAPATAPKTVDERTLATFRDAVGRNLSGSLGTSGAAFTVSPALIQLRKYTDDGRREPGFYCIVDLALRDEHGDLVGSTRGRALATSATATDAMDAAVHAAAARLPEILQATLAARKATTAIAAR